jgi:hypothetical protein
MNFHFFLALAIIKNEAEKIFFLAPKKIYQFLQSVKPLKARYFFKKKIDKEFCL